MIISGGVNIYPAEVEAVLSTHPAVADVGVIGVPDDEWGEQVKAVVELIAGDEPAASSAEELIDLLPGSPGASTSARARSSSGTTCPAPRAGKLYKRRLRDEYWADQTTKL